MMRNRSWLAGLASKIFPRRFAAARRVARRRPRAPLRSFSDAPLATETLEPRHLLSGVSLVSVDVLAQGNEADGSPTVFEFTRTGDTAALLDANVILQGTAQPNVDYTAPADLGLHNTFTVTFDAGSDTTSVSLPTLSDSVIDPYDSVIAILQPGSGYQAAAAGDRATAVIAADGEVEDYAITNAPSVNPVMLYTFDANMNGDVPDSAPAPPDYTLSKQANGASYAAADLFGESPIANKLGNAGRMSIPASGDNNFGFWLPKTAITELPAWTVILWANRNDLEKNDFLFYVGAGDGFSGTGSETYVFGSDSQALRATNYSGNTATWDISGGEMVAKQWHQVAFSYSGSDFDLYLDGNLVANADNASIDGLGKSGNSVIVFGAGKWMRLDYMRARILDGLIDQIEIYDSVLGPTEIAERYDAFNESLAVDLGDAPLPYPVTQAEGGAEHVDVGPTLGSTRDVESDGTHSAAADADGADEDGVTFGVMQVGALDAQVTVNVQGVSAAGAKLDAWIDFSGDGNWGGHSEHVLMNVDVTEGDNLLTFDVPSWAAVGTTYARFRLSTDGNPGIGGWAADGEVEDYAVNILPPALGSGIFSEQIVISTNMDAIHHAMPVDFDGDGDMDIVQGSIYTDTVSWFENDGAENFSERIVSTNAEGVRGIDAADIDGDGDLDVLSASWDDNKIAWHENLGGGSFTEHFVVNALNAVTVFAEDVDGDGDYDLLSGSNDGDVNLHLNNGQGTFTNLRIANLTKVRSIHATDIDGDGDLDLLSAGTAYHIHRNDGSLNFTTELVIDAWSNHAMTADMDGDGDQDIVGTSDGELAWFEQNNGNFIEHVFAMHSSDIVFVGDMDGDGDPDVLAEDNTDEFDVYLYTNNPQSDPQAGNPSREFLKSTITSSIYRGASVHGSDVDGDGDLDIVSTSTGDDKLAWYRQNAVPTLDAIADASIDEDGSVQLAITGISAGGTESESLLVSAISSDPSLVPNPAVIYTSGDATGQLLIAPAGDQHGTVTITVLATDAGFDNNLGTSADNATLTRTFTLTVNPLPDAGVPSFDPQAFTVVEHAAAGTVVGTLSATDPDGDPIAFLLPALDLDGDGVAALRIEGDSLIVNDPDDLDYETNPINIFPVDATDGLTTVTATITLTLTDENEVPTLDAINDLVIDEDAAQQAVPLSGISAGVGESQDLTVSVESDNPSLFDNLSIGYTSPAPTGVVLLAPAADQHGSAVVTVKVQDSGGLEVERSFTLTVNPANDAPTFENQGFTVAENSAEGTLLGLPAASDIDGDALTYSIVSNADPDDDGTPAVRLENGQLVINDAGDFDFDVNPELLITVEASDGSLSDTAVVTIEIIDVNQPPAIIGPGDQSSNETDVISLQLSATDPDGDALTWNASGLPSGLSIDSDTGLITGTLAYDEAGSYNVSVSATDGDLSATESFTWTVANTNQLPVVISYPAGLFAVNEDESLVFSTANGNAFTVTDPDGSDSVLRVQLFEMANDGSTISLATTSGITFVSGSNDSGSMFFDGTVSAINAALDGLVFAPPVNFGGNDGLGIGFLVSDMLPVDNPVWVSGEESTHISVTPVNDPPINILPGDQTTAEAINLVFSAANGNEIIISDYDSYWPLGSGYGGGWDGPYDSIEGTQFDTQMRVSLSVDAGNLTLATTTGITFVSGSNQSAAMTMEGLLSDLNQAIDGLVYSPPNNFTGDATLTVHTDDLGNTGGGSLTDVDELTITVNVTNDAPTGVVLVNEVASLPEDTDTSSAVKVADVVITDDGVGTNTISLTGTDATSFTVVGTELYLAAGTVLDYETQTSYSVTVSVEDSSVSGSTPVTVDYLLTINDVNESDYGDAAAPYPVTQAEGGAEHIATGPILGSARDVEADGTHSAAADADGADEDGVTFGAMQVGALDAQVTVNVQGVSAAGAKLDAWIDFSGDGNWGGHSEHVLMNVDVTEGDNLLAFDVPSWAAVGTTYARFRVSTDGNPGIGDWAADGEVEDYAVNILPPALGSGIFSEQIVISTNTLGTYHAIPIDFDGDGDMDIVQASINDDTISWFENDGAENFSERIISTNALIVWRVDPIDVDGDGDLDVLSASWDDNKIAWHETLGDGSFSEHVISTSVINAHAVFAEDMDGDGDYDVLSGSNDGDVNLHLNDGQGTFTTSIITNVSMVRSIHAIDIDRDGDLDLLTTGDGYWLHRNDGSLNFTSELIADVFSNHAVTADIDMDGDPDIVGPVHSGEGTLAWFEQNGGVFTEHTIAQHTSDIVFVGDMDGDGDPDILAESNADTNSAVYLYTNNTQTDPETDEITRIFTETIISSGINLVSSVFGSDIDGDGDLDVISTSNYEHKLAWYRQNALPTLDAIADASVDEDGSLSLALANLSAGGTESESLRVSAISSDPSLVPNPAVVYTSGDATGQLLIAPASDQHGTVTITVFVTDAGFDNNLGTSADNATLTQTFTLTVNPLPDPPTFADQSFAVSEESPVGTVIGTPLATDADGDSLSFSLVANVDPDGDGTPAVRLENNQFVVNDADDFNYETAPLLTVTAEVTDGTAATTAEITFSVIDVNETPTLNPIGDLVIDEDAPQQVVPLTGISAGAGESQSITVVASTDVPDLFAELTVDYSSPNALGNLMLTPAADQFGQATVTVTVEDSGSMPLVENTYNLSGDDASGQVGISGYTINSFIADRVGTGGNSPEGLALIYLFELPTLGAGVTLSNVELQFQYTETTNPGSLDFNIDLFGIDARDDAAFTASDYYDGPAAQSSDTLIRQALLTPSSATGGVNVSGAALDAFLASLYNADGTPVGRYATFRVNPDQDFPPGAASSPIRGYFLGLDGNPTEAYRPQFNFDARWGEADDASFSRSFQVTVNSVPDAPAFADQSFAVAEESPAGTVIGTPLATDADGEPLSFSLVANVDPDGDGTPAVRLENDQFVINDADDFDYEITPSLTLTAEVTDGTLATTAEITISLIDINEPPTLDPIGNQLIDEDAPQQVVPLTGIGPGVGNTDAVTVIAVSSHPEIIPHPAVTYSAPDTTGSLAFTPAADQFGAVDITVTVTDLQGAQAVQSFRVDVNGTPDAVVFDDQTLGVQAGSGSGTIIGTLAASDPDGDAITYTLLTSGNPDGDQYQPFRIEGSNLVVNDAGDIANANQFPIDLTIEATDGTSVDTAQVTVVDATPSSVSIATTASGSEADGAPTEFVLTRVGPTNHQLTVNLILQGTAQPGIDYTAPAGLGVNNTLAVIFAAGSDTASVSLPTLSDSVIDSYENILAILQPGNFYNVQPDAGRSEAYITAESVTILPETNQTHTGMAANASLHPGCFAALRGDGSIAVWGDNADLIAQAPSGQGYTAIFSNEYAFAALHADGTVTAWGDPSYGGDVTQAGVNSNPLTEVVTIHPSRAAFTALRRDGSLVTWGSVPKFPAPSTSGVAALSSNFQAVAALTMEGEIVAWGSSWSGGSAGYGSGPPTSGNFIQVVPSYFGFAALDQAGVITVWGGGGYYDWSLPLRDNAPTGDGYVNVISNTSPGREVGSYGESKQRFAALHADGSIASWGSSGFTHNPPGQDYVKVFANNYNFAALRSDGSIYGWNHDGQVSTPAGTGFTQVIASKHAFTAIRADNTAVSWGATGYGGDSTGVAAELTNVTKVISNERAFVALRADGSYVSWGDASYGGNHSGNSATEIVAIGNSFAARLSDGSIASWGGASLSDPAGNQFVSFANHHTRDAIAFDSFLTISPAQISEGAGPGAATGTVTRTGSLAGELVVILASSDTSEATVPATVTIPAGQALASFLIDAVNDELADLIQPVIITASVAGQYYGRVLLEVADDGDGALFIDDGDPGYSSNQSPVVVETKGYDGDYRWILGTTPDSPYYIEYEATDIAPGDYEIATTWQTQSEIGSFQRHNAVQYEIYDGLNLVDTVTVNQQQAPAADYTAGGENFEVIVPTISVSSDSLAVKILVQSVSAGASGYRTLSADAVRISIAGGVSNTVPVITVLGDSPDSVLVSGTGSYVDPGATASDPQDGDLTGSIVVSGSVDVTTTGTYVLQYDVQDSDGNQAAAVTRTVYVIGNAPVFDNQAFSAAENSVNGTVVGTLVATDADGDPLTYSIAANVDPDGDGNAAFRLEGDQLLVNDTDDLDYETNPQLVIVAEANDGSQSDLADTAEITISIGDINETPLITLLGDASLVFEADNTTSYSDPGATASDDEDGNLTGSILVSGDVVDLSVPGTYLIDYDVQDSAGNDAETVSRTVLVQDTLKPVISLVGDMAITVIENVSEGFIDPGFTAIDSLDGDLAGSVVVSGVVDRTQAGTYQLSYDVADAAGNTAETVIRTVTVVANQASGLQIIDDGDPGYSSNQSPVTVAGQGYQNDYQWILGVTPDSPYYIQYESDGFSQGYYEIAATWQTESELAAFQRNEAVKYEIYDGLTLVDTVTVNQRFAPAADYVEGGENFEVISSGVPVVSDSLAVKILVQSVSAGASGYRTLSADAVRISIAGGVSNTVPVITVLGDSPDSVLVSGTGSYVDPGATASDPQDGDLTGSIVVSGSVDVTTTGTYVLQYDVQDSDGNQAAAVTRTVYVIGNAPVFDNQAFSAAENSVNGTVVGTLVATDADGDPLTYSIAANVDPDGDGNAAFRLEGDQLLVNDTDDLDYETNPQLVIVAEANDGSQSDLADTAEITISIGDINETPLITLLGDASLVFEADNTTSYSDPGATASDDEDGNLTGSILVSGDVVDLSVPGTYLIDYDVQDSAGNDAETVSRTVLVQDTIAPVIMLTGDAEITLIEDPNGTYSDAGFIASDSLDGDLTGSVVVSGVVDRTQVGTYQLSYDVADAAGNTTETVIRTVTVVANQASGLEIIDDGDAGYSSNQSPVTVTGQGYENDYQWILGTTPDSPYYIEYEATGLNQGYYEIAITWQTQTELGSYQRHEAVQYEIYDGESLVETVTVNQRFAPAADYTASGMGFELIASGVPVVSDSLAVRILVQSPGTEVDSSYYRTISADAVLVMADDGTPPVLEDQLFTVAENSVAATVVGTLAATDADGDPLTYSIASNVDPDGDGNAAFRVEGDQILVNDVGDLDYEANPQLVIIAEASDGSFSNSATITINLTNVDEQPVFTLLGNSPHVVEASSTGDYSDPGATAMDPEDGDISGSVEVSGQVVNLSVPGSYVIEYDVADSAGNDAETVTRTVVVQDTLAPVITLTGDAVVNVTVDPGGTYSDAGATAVDSLDGDLTGSIVASGDVVDLAQAGTYTLTYNVSDNAGNVAEQVTRTVNVIPIVVEDVVILDDGEAGFAQSGFTEQSNAQVAAAYDSDVHHMQGGTGEASWTFTGLPADRYQVAATWAYKYNNNYNATDAPFTLSDGAGGVFSTQIVNQKNAPAEFEDGGYYWDSLDTVEVSGGTLVVTLGAGSLSNKWVVADAIRVSVAPTLTVTIADASVAESAGAAATTAIVTRNGSLDADLVVSLASNDLTEASVPASVTIPAGQVSASFSIDAVDDVFFDGTQSVNVLATATGYSGGSDSLEVTDDDSATTALIDDGEAGFAQSGFTYQNNAQVAAAYNGDNYWLRNGDDADQASWTFTGLDDGAYRVMATWAHKYDNNYNATDAPFQILDAGSNVLSSVAINQKNAPSQHDVGGTFWDTLDTVYVAGGELVVTLGPTAVANKYVVADAVRIEQLVQATPTLVVQLGEEIVDEDAGTVSGIVSRGAETVGDLVVTLNSDDAAVGTVPATVTIPDGAGAVPFTLTVVDDAVVDDDQNVIITASAAGYTGGSDSLLVEDDEFPPVQIIDNGDAGFTETGGFKERTWAGAYEGDNHYMRGSDGEARWQFTDLIDGEYTVSVTWDHISDNKYNATDAPFTIRNAADEQLLAAAVDQTLSPADFSDGVTDWHTLGTVYVIDGELTVSLTEALVNKYVVADAVRIEIDTNPTSKLLVILDASSVSEAGSLNGKVIRTGDPAGSLTVNLASDNAAAATVPATITLGEGARYGTFAITPTDDSTPDGTQVAGISATAAGFTAGTAALDVTDDDATILFVDNGEDGFVADAGFKRRNVAGAYQNDNHSMRGGTGEASWTFTGLEEGQYFVSATWNHIYENRYNTEKAPFSITNGSGNLLSTLTVDQTQTPDDFTDGGYGWEALAPVYINDGTLIVTLGASPTNHHAVADAIRIELNESLAPSLFVLVDTLSESAGASTGTVVRTGDVSSEATVGLTSSNLDAATVESSITFAIGESTKSFAVTPTDDSSPDGIQQSTIEATAASYAAGTAVLNVQDDDALEVAIMDNTDNGYTSNGFRYNANKQVSDAYGGNNESLKGGEPGEEASWTFTGLADGVYHVSATWNHQYNNNYNATDAQYSITNAGDEALATTTINQSNAPSEFLDNGIAWGTLDTVTVTGGELVVTVSGGSNPNRHTVADAVRIARVAQLGGSSMRMAEVDPFYDPLEDSLDDLASEWSGASEEEDQLVWGE